MALEEQGRSLGLRRSEGAGMDRRFFTAAHCGIFFAMGAAMACARVPEDGAPFGMAMAAAAGPGISGVSALLGAAAGYLLDGGLEWGVRYVAASVLVYTVAFVFHELPIYRRPFFMPLTAGAIMALTAWLGGFALTENGITLLAGLFLETALAFGGTYFFREALAGEGGNTEGSELRHGVAVMILLAALCMALSRIIVFDTVSIGRTAALLLVMASSMKGGVLTGTAVGTVLGLAMDIGNPGAPFYTMAYALSGLLSGLFGRHGRFLFVLSFVLSGALAVAAAWRTEMYVSALFETFCASVLFMLVPGSWLSRLGLLLQSAGWRSGHEAASETAHAPAAPGSRRAGARHGQQCDRGQGPGTLLPGGAVHPAGRVCERRRGKPGGPAASGASGRGLLRRPGQPDTAPPLSLGPAATAAPRGRRSPARTGGGVEIEWRAAKKSSKFDHHRRGGACPSRQ